MIISKILVGLWVINLALPIALTVLKVWINFINRSDYQFGFISLQKFKWGWTEAPNKTWRGEEGTMSWVLFDFFGLGFLLVGSASAICNGHGVILGFTLIGILLLLSPRFILDVIKALKYSWSTGKAERIDKLEKEIEAIKNSRGN